MALTKVYISGRSVRPIVADSKTKLLISVRTISRNKFHYDRSTIGRVEAILRMEISFSVLRRNKSSRKIFWWANQDAGGVCVDASIGRRRCAPGVPPNGIEFLLRPMAHPPSSRKLESRRSDLKKKSGKIVWISALKFIQLNRIFFKV